MTQYTAENNWGELQPGEESQFTGTKYSGRPTLFGKPVTCADTTTCEGTLDVAQKTTLNETEVVPPQITIGGHVFVPVVTPQVIDGGEIGADGKLPAAPLDIVHLVSG